MAKPLKFHHILNLPARSITHGKHRKSSPPAYRSPIVGADYSAGGSDENGATTVTWTTVTRWVTFPEPPKPKPPAIPYAGIRTGEIIGYRLWWVIREGGQQHICSLAHRRPWRPGETITGDINEPVDDAGFGDFIWGGTYAFATETEQAEEAHKIDVSISEYRARHGEVFMWGWCPYRETSSYVAGTIKMWGDVVEHQAGYRAQFAKLNSLDRLYGDGDIDDLRDRYGVA